MRRHTILVKGVISRPYIWWRPQRWRKMTTTMTWTWTPKTSRRTWAARKLVGDLFSESGYCPEGPVAASADDPEGVCRVLIQGNQDLMPARWVTNGVVCDEVAPRDPMDSAEGV